MFCIRKNNRRYPTCTFLYIDESLHVNRDIFLPKTDCNLKIYCGLIRVDDNVKKTSCFMSDNMYLFITDSDLRVKNNKKKSPNGQVFIIILILIKMLNF